MKRQHAATLVVTLITLMTLTIPGQADTSFVSGVERTSLLELYTSEGCSSCPPADRWLSQLQDHPGLWRDFVPLAFHVDYWDYIGWKDRFAKPAFGKRQRRYASDGGVRTVYTPGMVKDGEEWQGWRRTKAPYPAAGEGGRLSVAVADGNLTVDYQPENPDSGGVTAHVALLGFDLDSQVRAGENRGKTLRNNFVVLAWQQLAMALEDGRASASLDSTAMFAERPARAALAVWVSPVGQLQPLQAAGGWLP